MTESLGTSELYLGLALIIGFTVCWGTMFLAIRNKETVLTSMIDSGNLLRMTAVIFVVVSLGYLALIGKLSAEAAAIFSGIGGYVLGGVSRQRSEP